MYAWMWRHLPGPWPLRLLIFLVVLFAVAVALFLWVFPWVEETFEINRVTVG
ncbi:DUF4175 domain-containing protein [Phytoactinopolyspora limicola]|uniref:DUF4175 domain-containing protein n=1 Tax=Phytoactinopolyspora limicola TaxID=2715536 RepID=UPI00140D87DD|nr:DUF4175 domain-containing protein [Phytoactinopolyspora limicola]